MKCKQLIFSIFGWLTCSLFYFFAQAVMLAIAIAGQEIQSSLAVSQASFGLIISGYLLSYSFMQIPVGIMLDHFPIKRLLTIAIFSFTLGCYILSISSSFYIVLITRTLMGIVGAFGVLGAFKLATEWFDSKYFASLAGLTVSLGMIGGIVGTSMMEELTATLPYQLWFSQATAFGVLLTISSILFVDNRHPPSGSLKSIRHIQKDIKQVLMNTNSAILIIYAMLLYTPFLLFNNLGSMFLQTHYVVDKSAAASMVKSMLFASFIAAPLLGIVSDRMGRRLPLIKFCTIAVLALLLLMLAKVTPPQITVWLFGFFTWGFLIAYTIFKETHSEHIVSTGMGVMNSINIVGGIILAPIIGALIDVLPKAAKLSQADTYFYVYLLLPAVVIAALPLVRKIPETYCQQVIK